MLTVEADLAHLIAADPGRVRGRIDPGDEPRTIEGVIAAIGAVAADGPGRQFRPPVADDRHHATLRREHDPSRALAAIRRRQLLAVAVAGDCTDQFPSPDDRWHVELPPTLRCGQHLTLPPSAAQPSIGS